MNCPVCKDKTLLMTEKKGIEVDYCANCRGIWLDRGELEKLTEAGKSYEREYYAPKDEYKHDHKHYKRRKSFLEEIFD
ncbi:MAG: zf-TFIIB domain-containing protein [Bdellovibrionota bacterium]